MHNKNNAWRLPFWSETCSWLVTMYCYVVNTAVFDCVLLLNNRFKTQRDVLYQNKLITLQFALKHKTLARFAYVHVPGSVLLQGDHNHFYIPQTAIAISLVATVSLLPNSNHCVASFLWTAANWSAAIPSNDPPPHTHTHTNRYFQEFKTISTPVSTYVLSRIPILAPSELA
jgi:hypothetical protein